MKYFEVEFIINAPQSIFNDSRDILSALAGEVGFETFEETSLGLKGYVQQQLFNKDSLNEQIIGTWVDGRTLYQRTFIDTTTRVYNVGWFTLATLAEDVDEVIGYDGCAIWTNSSTPRGACESFGFYAASNHYGYLEFAKDTKALNVLLITFSGRSWIKVIATIQYVKVESE